MSLIPFILDLADELQEYQRCLVGGSCSAMDIDDVDFGLQSLHEAGTLNHSQQQPQPQQQSQTEQRRPRLLSQLYWPSNILQKQQHNRHHPYQLAGRFGCNFKGDSVTNAYPLGIKSNSIAGLSNKPNTYPVINKNGWMMVSMNVKQFSPDELIVKTIDNCIIVEGRHEDKEDIHGVISRHFIRKYMLPKGYDPNEVVSTLSSDGILTVKAPPPVPPKPTEEAAERIVDIQQTGPAHAAAKQIPAAAAAVDSLEQTSPKEVTLTEQAESKENEKMQVQAQQIDAEPMLTEQCGVLEMTLEESENANNANIVYEQEEQKIQVDAQVTNVSNEDVNSAVPNVEDEKVAEKTESESTVAAATELLAESAKTELQVDVTTPAVKADTKDVSMDAIASATDKDVESAVDIEAAASDAAAAATKNGVSNSDSDANDAANSNSEAKLSNNTNENNGVDATVTTKSADVDNAEAPISVKKAAILPAEVPASLDLGLCVPKSIVMETANAALDKDTIAEADPLEEKNGVETNRNGDDVGVDVGAAIIGVSSAIEKLPAGGEELVAN